MSEKINKHKILTMNKLKDIIKKDVPLLNNLSGISQLANKNNIIIKGGAIAKEKISIAQIKALFESHNKK